MNTNPKTETVPWKIPDTLKYEILKMSRYFSPIYDMPKYLILPNNTHIKINNVKELLENLDDFFNETPISRFINYKIYSRVESTSISIELIPLVQSA